jgi:hypothetical protein
MIVILMIDNNEEMAFFLLLLIADDTAINIATYAVSTCTTEKLYYQKNLSSEQYALLKTKTIQSMSITRVIKLLLVRGIYFIPQSKRGQH